MAGHSHPSYFKIYIILLVLFALSVIGPELADVFGLESGTAARLLLVLPTAFGIALWKAYLVCAHFMHLKTEKIYAPYILLTCIALMFVFFFGVAIDVMMEDGQQWSKSFDMEQAEVDAKARYDEYKEGYH